MAAMVEITSLQPDRWNDYRILRLAALEQEPSAFGSSPEEDGELAEGDWKDRMRHALFALDRGTPIGMIAFAQQSKRKTRHIAGIYGVYVARGYRGQGVGHRLLGAALDAIQERAEIIKVRLAVNPEQLAAVRLYERHGFETVGRFRRELCVDGVYYDDLIMERVVRWP